MVRALNEKQSTVCVCFYDKITIRFVELMFFDFGARKKRKKKLVTPTKRVSPTRKEAVMISLLLCFLKILLAKIIMNMMNNYDEEIRNKIYLIASCIIEVMLEA